MLIVKAQQPTLEWTAQYVGGNIYDLTHSLAVDSSGNVYVSGQDGVQPYGFVTVKYSPTGQQMWAVRFIGVDASIKPVVLGIDPLQNIYVAAEDIGGYILIKYSPNGVQNWVRRYDGNIGGYTELTGMVIDKNGNAIITGGVFNSGTLNDIATVKFKPNGDTAWVATFNSGGSNREYGPAISMNSKGEIALGGYVILTSNNNINAYLTVKYDSMGTLQWWKTYYNVNDTGDIAYDVAIDNLGKVYITGARNIGARPDYLTLKYLEDGTQEWLKIYHAATGSVAHFIKLDKFDNAIVTGIDNPGFARYATTIKYDSSSNQQWINFFSGPNSISTPATDTKLDTSGSIYSTGTYWIDSMGNQTGIYTFKLKPDGNIGWVTYYTLPRMKNYGQNLVLDKFGNVYVCGNSYDTTVEGTGMITIKYSQPVGIQKISETVPYNFLLFQNYPNPFNSSTLIKFKISKTSAVQLKVYDILGREIKTLIDKKLEAGTYEVSYDAVDLPSGVYIYKIKTEFYQKAIRMVLLK